MTDQSDGAAADPDSVLGENIRRAREGRGMTQKELAEALRGLGWDIDPTAVTRIEKGDRAVRVNQLYVLAEALGVRPANLLRDEIDQINDRYVWIQQRLLSARRDLVRALSSMGTLQRLIDRPGSAAVFERARLEALHEVGVLKYAEQILIPAVRAQDRVHLPPKRAETHGALLQQVANALAADTLTTVAQPGPGGDRWRASREGLTGSGGPGTGTRPARSTSRHFRPKGDRTAVAGRGEGVGPDGHLRRTPRPVG
ncbi:helix-turn-helix transcriptional regulator [Agrobacterium sp. S2]|nr:helix-turn-helix transcriptional regulator [Agrobacterium sp. S2]